MKGTALITGGAQRIGKAIALCLAKMGYSIALTYSSSEKEARETASEITSGGASCSLFHYNSLNDSDLFSLISLVKSTYPDLHILVNNASVFEKARLLETETDLFDRHFAINLRAPYFLSRDFARACTDGHIINILDSKIAKNLFEYSAYTLSKKALAEFTLAAARELAPRIRVNGIAPGLILPPAGELDEYLDRMAQNVPLKRKGSTDAVTESVKFLIENEYVTGQIIYADGGQHL